MNLRMGFLQKLLFLANVNTCSSGWVLLSERARIAGTKRETQWRCSEWALRQAGELDKPEPAVRDQRSDHAGAQRSMKTRRSTANPSRRPTTSLGKSAIRLPEPH